MNPYGFLCCTLTKTGRYPIDNNICHSEFSAGDQEIAKFFL